MANSLEHWLEKQEDSTWFRRANRGGEILFSGKLWIPIGQFLLLLLVLPIWGPLMLLTYIIGWISEVRENRREGIQHVRD